MKNNIFHKPILVKDPIAQSTTRNQQLSKTKSADNIFKVPQRSPEFGKRLAFAHSFAKLLETQPFLLIKTTDDLPVMYRMNTRYKDQERQSKIIGERLKLIQTPSRKVAQEPLDYESLSPENSPYRDYREGPGCIPRQIESKAFASKSE